MGSLEGFDELVIELTDDNVDQAALTITNAESVYRSAPDGFERVLDLTDVTVTIDSEAYSDPSLGAKLIAVAPDAGSPDAIGVMLNEGTVIVDEQSAFVETTWTINGGMASAGIIELDALNITEDGSLVAMLDGEASELAAGSKHATPNAATLSESFLGTAALVNQGAEFIADEGLAAMAQEARPGVWQTFGALAGGTSEYDTGTDVDVDGATLVAGSALSVGSVTMAGFVEAGWASSESNLEGADADGDHDYYGVGAAAMWQPVERWRLDGSLRAGRASSEFDGRYAQGSAQYDSSGLYASAHVGGAWLFALSPAMTGELYGRYVFTFLEGDDLHLNDEARTRFSADDTTTHALRAGLRLRGASAGAFSWRAGLAYEHVFDGDVEGRIEDVRLDAPTLSGDTVIGELGLDVKPSAASPWRMHFAVKGYALDRQGVSGSALVGYMF